MFKNFNKLEKAWIYYDIGNSAFTMMVSTIIPIWFNTLADTAGMSDSQYLAYWSYATSVATIVVAFLGPVLGTISDNKNFKKPMFMTVLFIGVIGCALLGVAPNWILYLVTYVIAKISYSSSLVLYDSMLTDVTEPERMDLVSSQGYAWGYIGSCIPFLAALVLYFLATINKVPMKLAIVVDFLLIAAWWLGVSMPLIRQYEQKYYVENAGSKIAASFRRLGQTLSHMFKEEKKIFFFLIGFFFYIDGVYTIIDEAVAIGTSLGLDTMGLLVVLLLTQVVAFAFATLFGKLSQKYSSVSLITVCIFGYLFVAIYALFMKTLVQFGIMAFVVGMFQGAIQALSRSYYAQIIPAENSGEYFGLYDICGKGAAFMGTTMVGITVSITKSVNVAVATLGILFILGFIFLRKSASIK
ncbi:MAG TPA: MFS transporter [Erysipelotrichaceae bacterium]|nr:MFS transporter [Erysipelotrichaceae bacterium]